jgi:hypothetical protein
MGGKDPVVRVLTPKQGLMGVVTTPPRVVTTILVVTTPVRTGCKLSVWKPRQPQDQMCAAAALEEDKKPRDNAETADEKHQDDRRGSGSPR